MNLDARPRYTRIFTSLALLGALGATLSGCPGGAAGSNVEKPPPTITITSPMSGDLVATTRVTVRGQAENTDMVSVNGAPVSVVGGAFETKVTVSEGEATVTVEAKEVEESVTFTADATAPTLVLTSPSRGQHIDSADADSVTIAGTVTDGVAGLSLFKINEQIIEPGEDGSFSYDLKLAPGLNEITMTAIDLVENSEDTIVGVMHGPFVDPTSPIEKGMEIVVSETVFPKIADIVKLLLTPERVSALVTGNLPIEGVNITRVAFAPPEITAIPRSNQLKPNEPGYIDFEVVVRDVQLVGDFTLSDNLIELDVAVSEATITTSMTIDDDGEGSIDITFGESTLDLPEESLSWKVMAGGGDLSDEDSDLLAGIVEDIARMAFSELLSEQIIEQLYDPAILTRTIDVLGRQMTFTLFIQDIVTNASGIYIAADLILPADKFNGIPDVPGALALELGIPESPMLARDGIVTTNQTALDRLMHGVWRSGLFNQTLQGDDFAGFELPIKLEAGALALLLDGRVTNHAENTSPAGIAIRPQLPPVMELRPEEDGGGLVVRMAELHMDLMLDVDKPSPTKLLTLAMFLEIGVGIVIEGTTVSFDVSVDGRADLVDEPLFDMNDSQVERLLNTAFLLVPKVLSQSLNVGGLADLNWLTINEPSIKIHGLDMDQVSVGLDIEANPDGVPPVEE